MYFIKHNSNTLKKTDDIITGFELPERSESLSLFVCFILIKGLITPKIYLCRS